eukprot:5209005-Prymnesium_polylepis.1
MRRRARPPSCGCTLAGRNVWECVAAPCDLLSILRWCYCAVVGGVTYYSSRIEWWLVRVSADPN